MIIDDTHGIPKSAATSAALPAADRVNESATSLTSEPSNCADTVGGERAVTNREGPDVALDTLAERIGRLAFISDRQGFSRGHVQGYVQCLHACFERIRCGGIVDGEYLTWLMTRPLVCKYCGDPLSEVERLSDDACADCAKRFGEDAR